MPSKQRSKSPMRSSGKKRRKSTADSKNNNNKTVATKNSDDKNTRTIQIVVKKPDPTHDPYVVSFPGGLPEGLQPGSTASLPRFTIRKNRERSRSGKTVTGKDRTCEYTATNQGRAYDGRCTKVCVGVFDKKRGILTIQQAAEKGHVFAMEQSVPMYEPASLEDNMTSIDRYKALFDDFGSAKKRKVIKSKEANRVTADAVIGAGRVMQHAFLKSQVMSESNRKAIEADDDDDDNDNMVSVNFGMKWEPSPLAVNGLICLFQRLLCVCSSSLFNAIPCHTHTCFLLPCSRLSLLCCFSPFFRCSE